VRRGALALLVAVAFAAPGCGGKKEVIATGAENTVTRFIAEKTPATAHNVSCPSGVEAEVGNTFDCTFDDQTGKHYVAHMRILSVDGSRVSFHIQSELAK
jgi:hypothetical protein